MHPELPLSSDQDTTDMSLVSDFMSAQGSTADMPLGSDDRFAGLNLGELAGYIELARRAASNNTTAHTTSAGLFDFGPFQAGQQFKGRVGESTLSLNWHWC
jgi:hypothetical protein